VPSESPSPGEHPRMVVLPYVVAQIHAEQVGPRIRLGKTDRRDPFGGRVVRLVVYWKDDVLGSFWSGSGEAGMEKGWPNRGRCVGGFGREVVLTRLVRPRAENSMTGWSSRLTISSPMRSSSGMYVSTSPRDTSAVERVFTWTRSVHGRARERI
jgi:hypothetical protein